MAVGTILQNIWNWIVYIGGLGFLGASPNTVTIAIVRILVGILTFTIFFAAGMMLGNSRQIRRPVIVVALVLSLISSIFLPAAVLVAIGAGMGTLVGLALIILPLIGIAALFFFTPNECPHRFMKFIGALILLFVYLSMKQHLKLLVNPGAVLTASNNFVDWAIFFSFALMIYYFFSWLFCSSGNDDDYLAPYRERLWDELPNLLGRLGRPGSGSSGPDPSPRGPSGSGSSGGGTPYTPTSPSGGSSGPEVIDAEYIPPGVKKEEVDMMAIIQLLIERLKNLEDSNARLQEIIRTLAAQSQTNGPNEGLSERQREEIIALISSLKEEIKRDLRLVIQKTTKGFSRKVKKLKKEIREHFERIEREMHVDRATYVREMTRIERELATIEKSVSDRQRDIKTIMTEIRAQLEVIKKESVTKETISELIAKVERIKETVKIIEKEREAVEALNLPRILLNINQNIVHVHVNAQAAKKQEEGGFGPTTVNVTTEGGDASATSTSNATATATGGAGQGRKPRPRSKTDPRIELPHFSITRKTKIPTKRDDSITVRLNWSFGEGPYFIDIYHFESDKEANYERYLRRYKDYKSRAKLKGYKDYEVHVRGPKWTWVTIRADVTDSHGKRETTQMRFRVGGGLKSLEGAGGFR